MRVRLNQKERILVLEGLAHLFQYQAGRDKTYFGRAKVRDIFLLFKALAHDRIGRRETCLWHEDDLVRKRRVYYRDMQESISDLRNVEKVS